MIVTSREARRRRRQWELHDFAVVRFRWSAETELQHSTNSAHVDRIEAERRLTNCFDASVAVLLAECDQRVRRSHLREWNRTTEQPLRELTDVLAVLSCSRNELVDVAQRV